MMTDSTVEVTAETVIPLMRLYNIRRAEQQYLGDLLRKAVGGLYKGMTAPYYSELCNDLQGKREKQSKRSAETIANDLLKRMRNNVKGGR